MRASVVVAFATVVLAVGLQPLHSTRRPCAPASRIGAYVSVPVVKVVDAPEICSYELRTSGHGAQAHIDLVLLRADGAARLGPLRKAGLRQAGLGDEAYWDGSGLTIRWGDRVFTCHYYNMSSAIGGGSALRRTVIAIARLNLLHF